MLSLLIDTSTEQGLAAIARDHQLLFQGQLPPGLKSSAFLLPEIQSGLKQLNLRIQDLDSIVVGKGPGSYTGIRMGVITAKTLAFASNLPLIGLCTLHAFTPSSEGEFAVFLDAGISGVYAIRGTRSGNTIAYSQGPEVLEMGHLLPILDTVDTIVCPAPHRIQTRIDAAYPQFRPKWEIAAPDPLQIYRQALSEFEKRNYSLNGEVDILYLRKTQAEMEREKKIGIPELTG